MRRRDIYRNLVITLLLRPGNPELVFSNTTILFILIPDPVSISEVKDFEALCYY